MDKAQKRLSNSLFADVEECIGIDLGTTYSSVGIWRDGRVEIIANDLGNRTTPSYVAFNEMERLMGEAAMHQAVRNPNNTVFDAKRLIGRQFTDSTVQADMKHWPFKVIKGTKNTPMIEIECKGEKKQFRAEEISAMILTKMKSIAEEFLGKKVKNAVITVPAYFNASQLQSTKDAGKIAGLNVLRIISEPNAAALAYGLHLKETEKNILVFDLGGGTFDVSVLQIKNGTFKVKAKTGDTHLGGEDFDNRIVDYFVEQFREKFHKDITDNPRSLRRLRTECEKAKRVLSSSTQVPIELDSLYDGIDFNSILTRARFEDLCRDYFQKCIELCNGAIADSKIVKDDIDDIVLVGGSTRIPKIQSMVKEMFKGKELCLQLNPDEAVAYGATVQATMLSKVDTSGKLLDLALYDVTPLSLGIEVRGALMSTIIPRNTTIPVKLSQGYITAEDNQTEIGINVYEGERSMIKDNKLLGHFRLVGLRPLPRGKAEMDVTFEIDANGILNVSAVDKTTGNVEKIVISYDTEHLSKDDVERMISDAKRYQVEDEVAKKRAEAKLELEKYCLDLKSKLKSNDVMRMISAKNMEILNVAIDIALVFNETNPSAEVDEYKRKQNELKDINQLVFDSYKKVDIPVVEGKPLIGIVGNALWKLTVGVIVPVVVGAISS